MAPKVWRRDRTERRGVKDLGSGLRWRTNWMPAWLYEKMHVCDRCGFEGEIYASYHTALLHWTGESILCPSCYYKWRLSHGPESIQSKT